MLLRMNRLFSRLDIKLTVYYTLLTLFLLTIFTGFVVYRLEKSLMKQVDKLLRDEAQELIKGIEEAGDLLPACEAFKKEIAHRRHFPLAFRVFSASGEELYSSRGELGIALPSLGKKTSTFCTVTLPGIEHPLRLYEKKVLPDELPGFILQLITETRESEEVIGHLSENLIPAFCIVLFLSIIGGMLASRKPRSIISDISRVTRRISSQNLSERLPRPAAHDEIYDLTHTINTMLDRLEDSFKEIKQFTSDVSHELRNPLFSLKGEMEVTLSNERTRHEYRDVIHESLERVNMLSKMVSDLFLISRFELKKIDLDMLYLNLGDILHDLYDFFLPMAQEKKLAFTIDRCDSVLIFGDKARIHQLLSNLIDNAVKFTPENGSVTLSLSSENSLAHLSIRDTGIGIPPDDIPYVFNRLYQVDKARSGSSRGTGLGLHISKKIADAHGGSITVTNNEERGVTFTVVLPKAQ